LGDRATESLRRRRTDDPQGRSQNPIALKTGRTPGASAVFDLPAAPYAEGKNEDENA